MDNAPTIAGRRHAGRRFATRALPAALFLILVACGDSGDVDGGGELAGGWRGTLDGIGGEPPGSAEVELELEQDGARLTGNLFFHAADGPLRPLGGKRLQVRQGLFADGNLYLNLTAPVPGGSARINVYGSADAEKIEADAAVWLQHVNGDVELPARLVATRP